MKKDLASFKHMLEGVDGWDEKVCVDHLAAVKKACKLAATTRLEWKLGKCIFSDTGQKAATDAIKTAESKFNRFRSFSRIAEVHPALLKLRDEIVLANVP